MLNFVYMMGNLQDVFLVKRMSIRIKQSAQDICMFAHVNLIVLLQVRD